MRQLFSPFADAVLRLGIFTGLATLLAVVILIGAVPNSTFMTGVGDVVQQPVPFSHKHHVAELGIDCRYCHTEVEQQASAGIPPTWTCMTCHSQIWTAAPMLAPVRESLVENRPLHWHRVNRLPDYVYFNHSIHIAKGIGCSSCHGNVARMQLTWQAQNFTMSFCISCHRHPQSFVRPRPEIWNMAWTPPANQDEVGRRLVADYRIHGGPRLTDCSICHR